MDEEDSQQSENAGGANISPQMQPMSSPSSSFNENPLLSGGMELPEQSEDFNPPESDEQIPILSLDSESNESEDEGSCGGEDLSPRSGGANVSPQINPQPPQQAEVPTIPQPNGPNQPHIAPPNAQPPPPGFDLPNHLPGFRNV